MKASGQTLLADADPHKYVLNSLNVTVPKELKLEFRATYPCYDFAIYNILKRYLIS